MPSTLWDNHKAAPHGAAKLIFKTVIFTKHLTGVNHESNAKRFHPDRVDDRNRHYRYFGRHRPAGGGAGGAAGGGAAAGTQHASKYVQSVVVKESSPWDITVAIAATAENGIPTGLNGNTIKLFPLVEKKAPTATSTGAIDWACTSAAKETADKRFGTGSGVTVGTLPAKYAPSECK